MKYLNGGLGAVLLFAVVIRVSAELITPILPLLVALGALVFVLSIVVKRTSS